MELTSKQRAQLRAMANTIDPIITVGKGGISDELVKQEILSYREQVKALKIVIPESLKEVYESVNAVASCK